MISEAGAVAGAGFVAGSGSEGGVQPAEPFDLGAIEQRIQFGPETINKVRLVGLIFGQPYVPLVRDDIKLRLDYLNFRSEQYVDFFCIGFSRRDGHFNAENFNKILRKIEKQLDWRYRGETDLILMNARYNPADGKAHLDPATAVSLTLERAIEEKAIFSAASFLEDIIAFAETHGGSDPSWGFSDKKGIDIIGSALKNLLLAAVPEAIRDNARRAFHLHVHDLRPPARQATPGDDDDAEAETDIATIFI